MIKINIERIPRKKKKIIKKIEFQKLMKEIIDNFLTTKGNRIRIYQASKGIMIKFIEDEKN